MTTLQKTKETALAAIVALKSLTKWGQGQAIKQVKINSKLICGEDDGIYNAAFNFYYEHPQWCATVCASSDEAGNRLLSVTAHHSKALQITESIASVYRGLFNGVNVITNYIKEGGSYEL